MTGEYSGPGNLFTIRFPDDWTFDRGSPRGGELDAVVFHKHAGGVGALRLTAWQIREDVPDAAEKWVVRTRELYSKPLREETQIYDWIPIKNGFIRASAGAEDGVPVFITLYVVAGKRCAVMATYVVPLFHPKTPEKRAESEAVSQMILGATLT